MTTARSFAHPPRGQAVGVSVLEPLRAAARQAASLAVLEHRPYPLPSSPWFMGQSWINLLFAHWPLPPDRLAPHVPAGLELETFDGSAWLGVTPFRIAALRLRGAPPAPLASSFLEVNVRTYVTREGRPGIWFMSLDASSRLAVEAARRLYRLPYFRAAMRCGRVSGRIEFRSTRSEDRVAAFDASYGAVDEVFTAEAGTLEHFLAERYCLYAEDAGRLFRAEIHHRPWPLQRAEAEVRVNTMPPEGIDLPARDPLLHFAAEQDVVIWRAEPL